MNLALNGVNRHFEQAIGNVHKLPQRPPLTEDAKKLIERILADENTRMKAGYRIVLEQMVAAS